MKHLEPSTIKTAAVCAIKFSYHKCASIQIASEMECDIENSKTSWRQSKLLGINFRHTENCKLPRRVREGELYYTWLAAPDMIWRKGNERIMETSNERRRSNEVR